MPCVAFPEDWQHNRCGPATLTATTQLAVVEGARLRISIQPKQPPTMQGLHLPAPDLPHRMCPTLTQQRVPFNNKMKQAIISQMAQVCRRAPVVLQQQAADAAVVLLDRLVHHTAVQQLPQRGAGLDIWHHMALQGTLRVTIAYKHHAEGLINDAFSGCVKLVTRCSAWTSFRQAEESRREQKRAGVTETKEHSHASDLTHGR